MDGQRIATLQTRLSRSGDGLPPPPNPKPDPTNPWPPLSADMHKVDRVY